MSDGKYLYIDKWKIHYSVFGKGSHVVLFMAGGFYCATRTFQRQYEHFDLETFTVVLWDPPGIGRSFSPEREITDNFYSENADFAYKLMKALNFARYSLCGVCGGGHPFMILAARYPEVVRALVLVNTRSQVQRSDVEKALPYVGIENLIPNLRESDIAIYGKDYITRIWTSQLKMWKHIAERKDGNICVDYLKNIVCPTFIIGSEKDPFIDVKHSYYLNKNIEGSQLYVDPGSSHSIHYVHYELFNSKVQNFLRCH